MGATVSIASVVDYGEVLSTNVTQYVARDLAWSGQIGYTVINTYGDTFHCDGTDYQAGRTNCNGNAFFPNSASVGTSNPLRVTQYNTVADSAGGRAVTVPPQFCPFFSDEQPNASNLGMGITAVQNVDNVNGVLFFLKLNRGDASYVGSGIAKVDNSNTNHPTCTRLSEYYWNGATEPAYGSKGSYSGTQNNNQYVYGLGNFPPNPNYFWLTRAVRANALDATKYEYYHGPSGGWSSSRLYNPTASQAVTMVDPNNSSNTVPLTGIEQPSINWNNYYKAYIMLDGVYYSYITIRAAYNPEGPWSNSITVLTVNQTIKSTVTSSGTIQVPKEKIYAGAQQPWYDTSGKSLLATYTHQNYQRLFNITFK